MYAYINVGLCAYLGLGQSVSGASYFRAGGPCRSSRTSFPACLQSGVKVLGACLYKYVCIFTSVGLLFCCFVSFGLCLALAWKCLYICIIGFVVLLGCGCWVVVLVMACRCRYIHAFFCLLLVVSCVFVQK